MTLPSIVTPKTSKMLALVSLGLCLAGCEYLPFSGGELSGQVVPAPAQWSVTDTVDVIELETNPSAPYSVKLWVIGLDDALYVHAGANRATWVENIEQDPNVRLLVEDAIYQLRAERVTDAEEFARFITRYESKYGRRPRNENIGEVYLYRLKARE